MAEHLKRSETELNELLAEYWKLRHETGMLMVVYHPVCSLCCIDVYMETLANKLNMRVITE
jgi:kinetochore protein Nuf2